VLITGYEKQTASRGYNKTRRQWMWTI